MKYSDENWNGSEEKAIEYALIKSARDFDQGWQGIEYKLNTVGSSRGDYPFVTVTLGLGTGSLRRCVIFPFLRYIREDRVRPDTRNRYFSRRSYFFMTKRSMVQESAVRIFLRLVWSVPPKPCIRTGCLCPAQAIFPVCTGNTEGHQPDGMPCFLKSVV